MKNSKALKLIAISVSIVIIGSIWYFINGSQQPATENTQPLANTPAPPQEIIHTPSQTSNNTGSNTSAGQTQTVTTASAIKITSPATSAKWALSGTNYIQWSKEAGFTGGIYLVNASDKSIAGWITSNTDVHQTSYAWNTRDLYISRNSPTKKTVQPGNYIIKITFDSQKLPDISSGEFSIVYPSEIQPSTYSTTISNLAFDKSSITLQHGDKLTFMNKDNIDYKLTLSGFSPFLVPAGGSFTFDTSVLFSGSYVFYSAEYPTIKISVTVQ